MNRKDFTRESKNHDRSDHPIHQAESHVRNSLDRFERAMDRLAGKVEGTTYPYHRAREMARQSTEKVKDYSNRAVTEVKNNPMPYILGAFGIAALAMAVYYLKERRVGHSSAGLSFKSARDEVVH